MLRIVQAAYGVAAVASAFLLLGAGPANAQRLQDVQDAHRKVDEIRQEMNKADPYPGGKHWEVRLKAIRQNLERHNRGERFRWFSESIDQLDRDRTADVQNVDGLIERLKLIEKSFEPADQGAKTLTKRQIKALLPEAKLDDSEEKDEPPEPPDEQKEREEKRQRRNDDLDMPVRGGGGGGFVAPVGLGGIGVAFAYVFLGVIVVVLLLALGIAIAQWLANRPAKKSAVSGKGELALEGADDIPDLDKQHVPSLWREADELARAGRYLEATRVLYLGVLALLHQSGFIRYERTRTNGEYANQLRQKPVHRPFLNLTRIFEVKWYGERSCLSDDYQSCRGLAETIRESVNTTPA